MKHVNTVVAAVFLTSPWICWPYTRWQARRNRTVSRLE